MALSEEQIMALMGSQVRIVDPPADQPELLNKIGTVGSITNGIRCVLQLEDGSGVLINVDQIQPI